MRPEAVTSIYKESSVKYKNRPVERHLPNKEHVIKLEETSALKELFMSQLLTMDEASLDTYVFLCVLQRPECNLSFIHRFFDLKMLKLLHKDVI